jgi:Tfp pilus assembly protein PilF
MNACAVLLLSLALAACATRPAPAPPDRLFNDHLFHPASAAIRAEDVLALSVDMKRFLSAEIGSQLQAKGLREGFVEALYTRGQLRLEYESAITRNAAQTFDARAGNCLSLVLMTAALAKEIGLAFTYQRVYVEDTWTRSGDVLFSVGHVNLAFGRWQIDRGFVRNDRDVITIDFLPPQDVRRTRTRAIGEDTIVAMYLTNRAAETLAAGRLDDAYWWARAAIAKDPGFYDSYNVLGVVYRRHGNLEAAERVLAYVLDLEPANTNVMSNLAGVLGDLGRIAERNELMRKLERLEPNPPFAFFNRGQAALRDGNFAAARDLFAKEVDRAPYYHEFHFWLAVAYVGLGELEPAREELSLAIRYSTTGSARDLYAAKLDRITSQRIR